jgi:hypothetical protein
MYYLLAVAGVFAVWKGVSEIVKGLTTDALYEDARKNRIRTLNQIVCLRESITVVGKSMQQTCEAQSCYALRSMWGISHR